MSNNQIKGSFDYRNIKFKYNNSNTARPKACSLVLIKAQASKCFSILKLA